MSGFTYRKKITTGSDGLSDCYDVTRSFEIKCSLRKNAIKRLLCAGARGEEYLVEDIVCAIKAATEALEDELYAQIRKAKKKIEELEADAEQMRKELTK